MIPTLETERLVLRPMTFEDWPDYANVMQSGHARFMGGPVSVEKAWGMFCHDLALWRLFNHGALMIEERGGGQCLGQVGINYGPLFPEHEIGWFLYPQAQGKGIAFEAAKAFRDWGFRERRLPTLVSYVDPDNLRSRKLAERLGATLDAAAPRNDPRDLVYRHAAPRMDDL
ncbi:GNAT family N-acetyltransferase [Roseibium salinum]|uniref:GNAT family N-acetyltransferase n=1 Tax=Roseibium salinum TaxID=1604349 RepID=A0ABT3R549_9HYPH|nr:GNAT family N-acetyltransferase [Roseibium sp. DSM 29163]MCX2724274.1 GNAT family N-acetyltransferase [Roseibium sp. DSM 29163]